MARTLRLVSLASFLAAAAFAQQGDRKGEEQPPVPGHIKVPPAPVLKPEEEHATFKLAPGFRAELVAADPLVQDPIAMQFGPDGRLWVLEMTALMNNVDGTGEERPICKVVVLTDTDRDGRYDERKVFVDNLVMPRAISLVGDGLLVGEPPKLWFFRDKNGDGVADDKKEIASDFGNQNNPEHNANGLMWAMDNWIYSANWTAKLRWMGNGEFVREPTITRGQWGISQDDWGRLYYNSNSDPLRVDAVPTHYLKHNPNLPNAAGANVQLVPANLKTFPSRVTPGINRGYKTLDENGKMYAVTAACGPVIYRGELFPAEFRGDGFIAEPSGNFIKRIKLGEKDGAFLGKNAYEGTEFMTSTDERFRPVNLFNGPDGALYVVDLYRGIAQHKIYITSFLRKQIEERKLDHGLHYGRIWRIVPDGAPKATFDVGLAKASSAELVAKLGNPNGWVRDTAQRLLVEKQDKTAAAALNALVLDPKTPATARVQALWALEGIGGLDRKVLLAALNDPDGHVAAAAVRLSENFIMRQAGDAELAGALAQLVEKRREPEVRLQLAFTLGEAKTPGTDAALRTLAVAAGKQPYVADAIVSGLGGREISFVEALVKLPNAGAQVGDIVRLAVSAAMKSGNAAAIDRVLALVQPGRDTPAWVVTETLAGIRAFLPRSDSGFGGRGGRGDQARLFPGQIPAEPKALIALAEQKDSPHANAAKQLVGLLKWPGKPGGESNARPLTAEEQALFEKGKAQYAALCAACHQPTGQGLAGLAPALNYSRWVLGDSRILARIVLNGKARENLTMPPWKGALNDEAVASVLTFIRRSWGHDADPVTVATVAEARAATAKRDEPFSDADLFELLQELSPARGGRRGGGGNN